MKGSRKKTITLSSEQSRILALNSQGLLKPAYGKGKKAVLSAVTHLGYVQIDTLAVVNRAHHHTIWSRVQDHQESYLQELLEKDKAVFEYWSHAASYIPMSDYRFSLPRKKAYADGKEHWFAQDKKLNKYVLDRIRAEGALQSKDFEFRRTGPGNWYEWKPAKKALEQLFMEGRLMVAKRQGFQKVYDLTERVLPATVDTAFPSVKEQTDFQIRKMIQAHGIVEEKEIFYLRKGMKGYVEKAIVKMLKEGELISVELPHKSGLNYLSSPEQLASQENRVVKNEIHILSPFDNVLIQRKRLQNIFSFDFMIECYLPEHKRKFGYFCLAVLYGDVFVGRFDPKADRISETFIIKSIYFEPGFVPDESFNNAFADKLKAFSEFNGCKKIVIDKAEKSWKKRMKDLIS